MPSPQPVRRGTEGKGAPLHSHPVSMALCCNRNGRPRPSSVNLSEGLALLGIGRQDQATTISMLGTATLSSVSVVKARPVLVSRDLACCRCQLLESALDVQVPAGIWALGVQGSGARRTGPSVALGTGRRWAQGQARLAAGDPRVSFGNPRSHFLPPGRSNSL